MCFLSVIAFSFKKDWLTSERNQYKPVMAAGPFVYFTLTSSKSEKRAALNEVSPSALRNRQY